MAGNPNWGKGKSGNPQGRPKRGTSLSDVLRKKLAELVIVADADGSALEMRRREIIAEKVMELAQDGDLQAIKLLLERTEGKVPDPTPVPAPPPPESWSVHDIVRSAMEES